MRPISDVDYGWGRIAPWGPPNTRALAEDGAVEAVLCRMSVFEEARWTEALRLTERVGELQDVLADLPRSGWGSGPHTLVGYPSVNLVLRYADGHRTAFEFAFSSGELRGPRAVRDGARETHNAFLRLWRAETARDPAEITPVACLETLPDEFAQAAVLHPAPGIVTDFRRGSGVREVPSALAVARACRYAADSAGRLTLREQAVARDGMVELRDIVEASDQGTSRLKCAKKWTEGGLRGVETVHATDVNGGTAHLALSRDLCGSGPSWWPGSDAAPEAVAFVTRMLG
ncbi:hypothetical protein [Actinocorallia sp. A-T 12471]|uniref:hypothetical protein n=1 Tax=Actinocorallia sp. A-T 12471 TaxID=3089813 RepID=UPI0029CD79E9|nr:hypothetical protein [Actinocorallia sp. A-T 12471]MDX6744827.1 hypothetical protein [Actinocorallia sp. A-T 12471]